MHPGSRCMSNLALYGKQIAHPDPFLDSLPFHIIDDTCTLFFLSVAQAVLPVISKWFRIQRVYKVRPA